MKTYFGKIIAIIALTLVLSIPPDVAFAAGGRSFGGSRSSSKPSAPSRSFGGSRSTTKPSSSPRQNQSYGSPSGSNQGGLMGGGRSFGGSRSTAPATKGSGSSVGKQSSGSASSFGGARSEKSRQMQAKYGTPRRQVPQNELPANTPSNYIVNDYGGFGHGLMLGYLAGSTPFMWSMPFHPAFYYSRPTYVYNDDGSVEVYPPTFQFGRLLLTIFVVGIIVVVVYIIVRNRRRGRRPSQSSFS